MKKPYFTIDVRDIRDEAWVFYQPATMRHGPTIRQEYVDLLCRKCRKLDYMAAIQRGPRVEPQLPVPLTDVFISCDHVWILTDKSRQVIEACAPSAITFYPLTNTDQCWIAIPNHVYRPAANSRIYKPIEPATVGDAFQVRGTTCSKCHRIRSVTFRSEWFEVPGAVDIEAAEIDTDVVPSFTWFASEKVIESIERANLSGWWIRGR